MNDFEFTSNLSLADPSFLRDSEIDVILGASEYASAIKSSLVKSEKNLIAQSSEFGWIVSGMINKPASSYHLVTLVTNIELSEKLNNFFDNGEFDNVDGEMLTDEEAMCEKIYEQTDCRDSDGRYIVTMPFKGSIEWPDLSDSKRTVLASFFSLERRLTAKPDLKAMYVDFIGEYIATGHMKKVTSRPMNAHYMPHHCVFKESTTAKLRVASNGKSLNEQLALGPMDQNDLPSILLRLRRHKIAFSGDIEKCTVKFVFMTNKRIYSAFYGAMTQMGQ